MDNKLVPIEHDGQRVITTELLAEVYKTDPNNIKNNFNNHKENFKEGVHYFLLQGEELKRFKSLVNDIDLPIEISKFAPQLYLWTERGANRHCKILDTPKAWEQFDHLEETYFAVKEGKTIKGKAAAKTPQELAAADKRATAMLLNAKYRTATQLQKLFDRAGVKAEYQALAISDFYSADGVKLPRIALQGTKITYNKGTIAEMVGIYSKASGGKKPHAQAVGAIISELEISEDEREAVPYCRNGHDGTEYQYAESVADKVKAWVEAHRWPMPIVIGGKNYEVIYKEGR